MAQSGLKTQSCSVVNINNNITSPESPQFSGRREPRVRGPLPREVGPLRRRQPLRPRRQIGRVGAGRGGAQGDGQGGSKTMGATMTRLGARQRAWMGAGRKLMSKK